MRESMEKLNTQGKEKELTLEKLKEIKAKEEERMKEDKTYGSPWKRIEPEHLTSEARELFALFEKGELNIAREKFQEVNANMKKIKNRKIKSSNTDFLHWIDDKIDAALSRKTLEEERQRENL